MDDTLSPHFRTRLRAIILSLTVSVILMVLKFYAWYVTDSAAILSDALESIINVVASGFATWSIILAATPPDANHPYGHGKIEYFSAGFEGALIILAAAGIIYESLDQLLTPEPLPELGFGVWLLAGASAVNLALGMFLVRTGRRTTSLALEADGRHLLTDVYTSVGVITGLALIMVTGWHRLDGIVAMLVALNIIYTGLGLMRESFARLMHEVDPRLLQEICGVLTAHRKETWIDVHRLRCWRSGDRVHMDFHLVLPRDMTLDAAHNEVQAIEDALKAHFGAQSDILIHADPCEDDLCEVCDNDPCGFRTARGKARTLWTAQLAAQEHEHLRRRG